MANTVIYLDESGDLGWSLDKPYRRGGSSRYLTLGAALAIGEAKKHIPRLVKDLYKKFKWPTGTEKKWSEMNQPERAEFVSLTRRLVQSHKPNIQLLTITVQKANVNHDIRADPNILYNYMINLLLTARMAQFEQVTLVPDPRSIKVRSGNSMREYLLTELRFTHNAATRFNIAPIDSARSKGLQFADMLSGAVQRHFEDSDSACFHQISPVTHCKRLFFT